METENSCEELAVSDPFSPEPCERTQAERRAFREGLLYGLAAYGWWGLVPIYFKAVADLPAAEILAHRIVWSLVFLGILVWWAGRWADVLRPFRDRRVLLTLAGSTVLIALNWLAFIYGVTTGQIVQASLGYFLLPLVSIALGMIWLKERLRPLQLGAVSLATAGVLYLTLYRGEWPWIALVLAFSFGFYGLLRKRAPVDGLAALTVEVLLLLPASALYLLVLGLQGGLTLGARDRATDVLLALSGVVTAVPLICFGQAARRLPLSALGFLQYLSPTLSLVLAVTAYREPFSTVEAVSFALIWAALAVYSADTVRAFRRNPGSPPVPPDEPLG